MAEVITQQELRQAHALALKVAAESAELEGLKAGLVDRYKAGATVQEATGPGGLKATFTPLEGKWSYVSWQDIAAAMGTPSAELVTAHTKSGAKPRVSLTIGPKVDKVRI
jgi:hypothetical protein